MGETKKVIMTFLQKSTDIDGIEYYVFPCPTCDGIVLVQKNEINCCIFRHGIYRSNSQQINPHASKIEIDNLLATDSIIGCGRPFILIFTPKGEGVVELCEYL